MNIYSGFIHPESNLETTQISYSWSPDKEHIFNGVLHRKKKEVTTDLHNNMDTLQMKMLWERSQANYSTPDPNYMILRKVEPQS